MPLRKSAFGTRPLASRSRELLARLVNWADRNRELSDVMKRTSVTVIVTYSPPPTKYLFPYPDHLRRQLLLGLLLTLGLLKHNLDTLPHYLKTRTNSIPRIVQLGTFKTKLARLNSPFVASNIKTTAMGRILRPSLSTRGETMCFLTNRLTEKISSIPVSTSGELITVITIVGITVTKEFTQGTTPRNLVNTLSMTLNPTLTTVQLTMNTNLIKNVIATRLCIHRSTRAPIPPSKLLTDLCRPAGNNRRKASGNPLFLPSRQHKTTGTAMTFINVPAKSFIMSFNLSIAPDNILPSPLEMAPKTLVPTLSTRLRKEAN